MENVELVVIINSYNRLALLKKSLDSLLTELNKATIHYAIVIFDAGSTDGSIEWIQKLTSSDTIHLKLIKASANENTSFSYGVNKACEFALAHFKSLRYFLLYETDNYLRSLEPIVQAKQLLEQINDLAACGFTVKKHDGSAAGFGCSLPSLLSFVLGQQLSFSLQLDKPGTNWINTGLYEYSYAEVVYTSPLLCKREAWEELRGFDYLNFPFSDCDIDLAKRIKSSGKKIAVIKTSAVIHDNLEMKSSWSATRTIRFYRSRLTYFKKHIGNVVHLFKPFLFITHVIEFTLLVSLVILKKRQTGSLKTRWFLITHVFSDYK